MYIYIYTKYIFPFLGNILILLFDVSFFFLFFFLQVHLDGDTSGLSVVARSIQKLQAVSRLLKTVAPCVLSSAGFFLPFFALF